MFYIPNAEKMTGSKAMPLYRTVPLTLFRIQTRLPVSLRSFQSQQALGRTSYDLKLHEGLVMPMPEGSPFHTPNGMSLRPRGSALEKILAGYKGKPSIYRLQEGLVLPESLVLFHEHSDHYSLQTAKPVPHDELNATLTEFLKTLPMSSFDDFTAWLNDEDDQDG